MEADGFLAELPVLAFQAVLLFARLGAAVMLLPGLGEQEVPATIRLGLGLGLVLLLMPALAPGLPAAPDDVGTATRLIVIEVVIGLWLGGLARLVTIAMAMAGQAVALLLGLAQALVPDPELGGQGTATGRLFSLAAVVVVLGTGLYALPLRALTESYAVLPVGEPFPAGAGAEAMAAAAAESFALALRLAAPFVLAAVVINVALGLLTRIAPQVQVYFLAVPGQVLAGVALLALVMPALLGAFEEAARGAFMNLPGLR
ncbi:flagellar biosynthetic protein FliR [Neoroseomonas lacus]|uniref:Flagellar biosynthetic protein FliR n=1 Tax=Neoroseomonas lacus TaxID=287609 RepID=A0A917K746_9PROT|nr:flagellar biosynthetic protein FliR [Neoroseomonas lacus]GGJ00634.1 flagellar biosynthetic protein FliR [Neoroseomonas lacus]